MAVLTLEDSKNEKVITIQDVLDTLNYCLQQYTYSKNEADDRFINQQGGDDIGNIIPGSYNFDKGSANVYVNTPPLP